MKRALIIGAMLLGLGIQAHQGHAAQPDTITLSVTPSGIIYSVQISSVPDTGYNFGTVTIAGTTVSTASITVANSGGGNFSKYSRNTVSGRDCGSDVCSSDTDTFRLVGQFQTNQPDQVTGFNNANAITGSFPGSAGKIGRASCRERV